MNTSALLIGVYIYCLVYFLHFFQQYKLYFSMLIRFGKNVIKCFIIKKIIHILIIIRFQEFNFFVYFFIVGFFASVGILVEEAVSYGQDQFAITGLRRNKDILSIKQQQKENLTNRETIQRDIQRKKIKIRELQKRERTLIKNTFKYLSLCLFLSLSLFVSLFLTLVLVLFLELN